MIVFELIVAFKLLIVTFYVLYSVSNLALDHIYPDRHPAGETAAGESQHHFYLFNLVLNFLTRILNFDNLGDTNSTIVGADNSTAVSHATNFSTDIVLRP